MPACVVCAKYFKKPSNLSLHYLKVHNLDKKCTKKCTPAKLNCAQCDGVFPSNHIFIDHLMLSQMDQRSCQNLLRVDSLSQCGGSPPRRPSALDSSFLDRLGLHATPVPFTSRMTRVPNWKYLLKYLVCQQCTTSQSVTVLGRFRSDCRPMEL